MQGKKWSLVVLAILIAASSTYTFSQAAIESSRKLPVSALRKMKPKSDHAGDSMAKFGAQKYQKFGAAGISVHAASSSGIPGIDSLANWVGQFTYAGFDGNGNPQSVWPFAMVGSAPETGRTTTIRAPIVPVVVELLAADGSVAVTFPMEISSAL